MKPFLLIVNLLVSCLMLFAQKADIYLNGYIRSDGALVEPYYRTSPNNTMLDNYSTIGNINPYTGKVGYIDPYKKLSITYFRSINAKYFNLYGEIFSSLELNDSKKLFLLLDHVNYEYRTFLTGIYNVNNGTYELANTLFEKLIKSDTKDEFIKKESRYWADI